MTVFAMHVNLDLAQSKMKLGLPLKDLREIHVSCQIALVKKMCIRHQNLLTVAL